MNILGKEQSRKYKLGAESEEVKGHTQAPLAVPPLCLVRVTGLNPRGKGLPFREGFLRAAVCNYSETEGNPGHREQREALPWGGDGGAGALSHQPQARSITYFLPQNRP